MPEGVALIIRYGFDDLHLHRLEAAIVPRNAASRRVAAKLGLREEGTSERFLQINGVFEDHVRYAITVEEWEERRERVRRPARAGAVRLSAGPSRQRGPRIWNDFDEALERRRCRRSVPSR